MVTIQTMDESMLLLVLLLLLAFALTVLAAVRLGGLVWLLAAIAWFGILQLTTNNTLEGISIAMAILCAVFMVRSFTMKKR